jgi:hypothetical protein
MPRCLCKDIIQASKVKGIDPFSIPFKPSDLGLKASPYGSFSDWCDPKVTKSGKWNKHVCLRVAEWHNEKPYRYILLPQNQWRCVK